MDFPQQMKDHPAKISKVFVSGVDGEPEVKRLLLEEMSGVSDASNIGEVLNALSFVAGRLKKSHAFTGVELHLDVGDVEDEFWVYARVRNDFNTRTSVSQTLSGKGASQTEITFSASNCLSPADSVSLTAQLKATQNPLAFSTMAPTVNLAYTLPLGLSSRDFSDMEANFNLFATKVDKTREAMFSCMKVGASAHVVSLNSGPLKWLGTPSNLFQGRKSLGVSLTSRHMTASDPRTSMSVRHQCGTSIQASLESSFEGTIGRFLSATAEAQVAVPPSCHPLLKANAHVLTASGLPYGFKFRAVAGVGALVPLSVGGDVDEVTPNDGSISGALGGILGGIKKSVESSKVGSSHIMDRFFLSGLQSMRGFRGSRGVGPRHGGSSLGGDVMGVAGVSVGRDIGLGIHAHLFANASALSLLGAYDGTDVASHEVGETPLVAEKSFMATGKRALETSRAACGAGLFFPIGSMGMLELNYSVPLRTFTGDHPDSLRFSFAWKYSG